MVGFFLRLSALQAWEVYYRHHSPHILTTNLENNFIFSLGIYVYFILQLVYNVQCLSLTLKLHVIKCREYFLMNVHQCVHHKLRFNALRLKLNFQDISNFE